MNPPSRHTRRRRPSTSEDARLGASSSPLRARASACCAAFSSWKRWRSTRTSASGGSRAAAPAPTSAYKKLSVATWDAPSSASLRAATSIASGACSKSARQAPPPGS